MVYLRVIEKCQRNTQEIGQKTYPSNTCNFVARLNIALQVRAGAVGSFDSIHCEMIDKHFAKPDAGIWCHDAGFL
jgi:hypothetical protein